MDNAIELNLIEPSPVNAYTPEGGYLEALTDIVEAWKATIAEGKSNDEIVLLWDHFMELVAGKVNEV